jgi:phage terminase large subunit GpA-like protein
MRTINSFLVLLFASTLLVAQQPAATLTKQLTAPTRTRRVPRTATLATPNSPPKTSNDFFVGEARVDVTKDETVVRLAMAQHGSILIELPANDGPHYIIPGDPEMATVDEKALERNKRAIVVRPGTQFVPPRHNVKGH